MPGWEDESLGAFGSGSNVPTGEWFPIDTRTGQWGTPTPTPTIASDAGVNWAGIPDLIPTRTMAPSPVMGVPGGAPDQAPLSIGQASGTMAPPMTMPASMRRVQRLDEMGALTRQPGMWETIARGVGMLSPQGSAILQASDQQQQQQLQNRLTMRRQALQEEQNERAEIRDDFNSLLKLSDIKSKKLRNLYTDRFVADMQARGKTLPPDFVEAFKTSSGDEAKAMVKFYEPLLADLGMDPTAFAELVDQGGIKEVGEALTLAQKLKKDKTEQARLAALDTIGAGETLGDVSGQAAPAPPGAPTPAPGARQPLATPSKEISAAIDASAQLYPQVRKDLITAIAASESNFDPQATSPKGAQGVMQLLPATGKAMGVTDPFDAKQNVRGGTRYYAQMLTKYKGNEALALAAYNWGPGNVDKVDGDLSKMPADTQAYVKTTLQRASGGGGQPADTRMQVAGPGAPAPAGAGQPAATTEGTPQEQQALAKMDRDIATMRANIPKFERIGGEEGNKRADNTRANLKILIDERNRLETRMLEPTRAAERLEASKQTGAAAAERQLETEMNKPIGVTAADELDLPAATKWKDVPKDRKPFPRPGPGERDALSHLRASVAGVDSLLGKLDDPKIAKMVGTIFTEPEAAVSRLLGPWLSTLPPEQRAFAATMAGEIMEIRHRLIGAGQTGIEVNALTPMMPSPDDTDVATVRAKLTALREGMLRRHDAKRDDLSGMGFRVPEKLAPPAAKPPLDPKAQQALDILKPKGT